MLKFTHKPKTESGSALVGLTVIALFLFALIAGPWLLLWSVKTLTGFYIPFTFKTWVAAVVFLALVRDGRSSK